MYFMGSFFMRFNAHVFYHIVTSSVFQMSSAILKNVSRSLACSKGSRYKTTFRVSLELTVRFLFSGPQPWSSVTSSEFSRYEEISIEKPRVFQRRCPYHSRRVLDSSAERSRSTKPLSGFHSNWQYVLFFLFLTLLIRHFEWIFEARENLYREASRVPKTMALA